MSSRYTGTMRRAPVRLVRTARVLALLAAVGAAPLGACSSVGSGSSGAGGADASTSSGQPGYGEACSCGLDAQGGETLCTTGCADALWCIDGLCSKTCVVGGPACPTGPGGAAFTCVKTSLTTYCAPPR
jgi:hypothetical protein